MARRKRIAGCLSLKKIKIMTTKIKVAILISGRGSNMQALIEACTNPEFPAKVVLVASNKGQAEGLKYAQEQEIPTFVLNPKDFDGMTNPREEFDKKMSAEIEKSGAQLICLAGFMRILSKGFINRWNGRIINIHPSLLPDFKGIDAVGDAIKAGAKISGCTTHYVVEEVDSGEIIMQAVIPIFDGETKEIIARRILNEEHKIYPKTLERVANELIKKLKI